MTIQAAHHQTAQALLDYIDASPSPWHAVATTEQQLIAHGFTALSEAEGWQLDAGGKYYVTRGAGSVIAFIVGEQPLATKGFRLVGAHTDSPSLRLKPKAPYVTEGLLRLGVEVYGGPILASFTDRDLSLAGRVNIRTVSGFESKLVNIAQPLVRLPNLAIHMNREVNEQGLKLNKQNELPLILSQLEESITANQAFLGLLSEQLATEPADILNWELNIFDTQKGVFWGAHQEFIANSQLDNLASCHAAITALLALENPASTVMVGLFDHEEVGSESPTGADGSLLADMIHRIALSLGLSEEERYRALAKSFFISADMAHAFHPNFPNAYEPCHHVQVNHGPVIKANANQRYTTVANTAAQFMRWCEQAGVPYQQYSHRTDLGCGSTIGPMIAANLGVPTVDVGNPMWAMHSIRESAGVLDHAYMIAVLEQALSS